MKTIALALIATLFTSSAYAACCTAADYEGPEPRPASFNDGGSTPVSSGPYYSPKTRTALNAAAHLREQGVFSQRDLINAVSLITNLSYNMASIAVRTGRVPYGRVPNTWHPKAYGAYDYNGSRRGNTSGSLSRDNTSDPNDGNYSDKAGGPNDW